MRSARLLVSLGLIVLLASASIFSAGSAATTMATAANRFLAGLGPEQKSKVQFAFDADERTRWHFIPNEIFARRGLTLKAMTPAQRDAAHALLKSGLSQHGYLTATTIMSLENVLRALENSDRFPRDPEQYWFSVRSNCEGHMGLALRGAPRLAPVHDRERHSDGEHADVLRLESSGGSWWRQEGSSRARVCGRPGPCAAECAH